MSKQSKQSRKSTPVPAAKASPAMTPLPATCHTCALRIAEEAARPFSLITSLWCCAGNHRDHYHESLNWWKLPAWAAPPQHRVKGGPVVDDGGPRVVLWFEHYITEDGAAEAMAQLMQFATRERIALIGMPAQLTTLDGCIHRLQLVEVALENGTKHINAEVL